MRQWAGTEQHVPTSAVYPAPFSRQTTKDDKSTAFDTKMNKERFHNQLALNLGYQRIVNDKFINVSVDDKQFSDDAMVSISIDGFSKPICYKASEGLSQNDLDCLDENVYVDIKMIADAVHQAYLQATTNPF